MAFFMFVSFIGTNPILTPFAGICLRVSPVVGSLSERSNSKQKTNVFLSILTGRLTSAAVLPFTGSNLLIYMFSCFLSYAIKL